jgi:hypothetical protein
MSYALVLSGFCLGFTFGIMTISRVSVKPQIIRAFRKAGLIKGHQARIPKPRELLEDDLDLI